MTQYNYQLVMVENTADIRVGDLTILTDLIHMTDKPEVVTVDLVSKSSIYYTRQSGTSEFYEEQHLDNLVFFRSLEGKILAGREAYKHLAAQEPSRQENKQPNLTELLKEKDADFMNTL